MSKRRRTRILLFLAAVGFVATLCGMVLALKSDHDTQRGINAALVLLIGWGFTGTGLYAWHRRPGNNIGLLLAGVGFSALLIPLSFSGDSALYLIGSVFSSLFFAVLVQLLLSFPSGRLDSRFQRFLVVLAYLDVTVVQVAWVIFTDPVKDGCAGCPANPIYVNNSTVAGILDAGQVMVAIGILACVAVILYRRWHNSGPAQRRAFSPVFAVGALTVAIEILLLSVDQANVAPRLEDALSVAGLVALGGVPFAFLIGLLRSRIGRAEAVSALVARLGDADSRGGLRDALADSLGDTGLELAYWVPDQGIYVDAGGRSLDIDPAPPGKIATVVEHDGRRVAAIVHDTDLEDERDLVEAVGAAATLTLENERLDAELRAHVEELRASRTRIVEAGYAERRRIERNLHDGAQQRLMALTMNLRLARNKVDSDPGATAELLDEALGELSEATSELRELARGIHPAVLTDRGLQAALTGLASRTPISVEIVETPADRLPEPVESAAYFVVSEALTNVARYASAEQALVKVARQNGSVEVEVRDDGVGGANPERGTGLRGLSDRIAALNGRLEVTSPEGEGTTVRARIPCA